MQHNAGRGNRPCQDHPHTVQTLNPIGRSDTNQSI